jgi:hypothetical protein
MIFAQIPINKAVFIDANIFIYFFTPDLSDFDRVPGLKRYAPV